MADRIALVIDGEQFEVRAIKQGGQRTLARGFDLEVCLIEAARTLGHPIVIPISGPDTDL